MHDWIRESGISDMGHPFLVASSFVSKNVFRTAVFTVKD